LALLDNSATPRVVWFALPSRAVGTLGAHERCGGSPMKKKTLRIVTTAALLGNMAFLAFGCAHAHEGPMEKAGRKTDEAASDVKHDVKKATD
jgi:hypothetical protein